MLKPSTFPLSSKRNPQSNPNMFSKTLHPLALALLSLNLISVSPTPAAAIPAEYPISLYNQTLCQGFIETAEVLNQFCFDFPDEPVVSVHISPGSVPEGWQWYAYSSSGCVNTTFVGIIPQGGCQETTIDGHKDHKIEGLVKSVNVVAPSS